jgi:acyl carrier protein
MNQDIERRIAEIIAKEAQIEASLLTPTAKMDDFDVPSITQFEAIFAIEDHFDVELPEDLEDQTLRGLANEVARLVAVKERT